MEVINGLPLFKSNDKEKTPELFPSTLQPLCFNDLPETTGKIYRTLENIVTSSSVGVRYKSCSEQFLKSYRKIHAVEYFFFNYSDIRVKVSTGTPAQMLLCEFCNIFKNTFFKRHLRMTASETETFL